MFRGFLSAPAARSAIVAFALGVVLGLGLVAAPLSAPSAAADATILMPAGAVGVPYLEVIPVDPPPPGGSVFVDLNHGLPGGLHMLMDGTVVGTATTVGTYTLTFAIDAPSGGSSQQMTATFIIVRGPQRIHFTSTPPTSPVVGKTYKVTATGGASGNPVTFSASAASTKGACTVDVAGLVTFTGAGDCLVDANQAGDANYLAASVVHQSITVGAGPQAITITSTPPASPKVDETYQLAATGGGSGQPVTFSVDSASTAGACSVNGSGLVRFSNVGTCVIDADQAGNANYTAAPRVTQTLVVGQGGQTIAFTSQPSANTVIGDTYRPTASGGGSGNPVTFAIDATSDPGACVIDGSGLVHLTGPGTCVIGADQAGNATYSPAPHLTQTVAVAKLPQTITVTSSSPVGAVVGDTYQVTATGGGSGNLVLVSIDRLSDGCSVDPDGLVTFTHVGACLIRLNQAGDATYAAATPVTRLVAVGKAPQVLTFTATFPAHPVVGDTFRLTATGGASGRPVTFSLDRGALVGICTVDPDGLVTFIGTGPCIADADQGGDADYLPAAQISQSTIVDKAPQFITISSTPPAAPTVGGTYQIMATGGPDWEPVVFSIDPASDSGACTVDHRTGLVTFTGPGRCVVDLDQDGDGGYLPAHASFSLTVAAVPTPAPGPTPTPTNASPGVTPAVQGVRASSALPFTGTAAVPLLGLAAALLLAGSLLLAAARGVNRGRHR